MIQIDRKEIEGRLDLTHIRREEDSVVPINGQAVKLPYMVIRQKENIESSDNGRVRYEKIEWIVALFTVNRDDESTRKIVQALTGVGKIEMTRYPDGQPYQTNFKFTTRQAI